MSSSNAHDLNVCIVVAILVRGETSKTLECGDTVTLWNESG